MMSGDSQDKVAVVEDEADLREAMASYLARHGFAVLAYDSAAAFRADPAAEATRVVVLDRNMPGESGLALALSLRQRSGTGIIMATAEGSALGRAVGLEAGADDYLVKPFELRELAARIRALLRRLPQPGNGAPAVAPDSVAFGTVEVDFARRTASRDGAPLSLTETDFALLRHLAQRPGRPVGWAAAASAMGRPEASARAVRIAISRLRAKIEADPSQPRHVKTAEGGAYVFEA